MFVHSFVHSIACTDAYHVLSPGNRDLNNTLKCTRETHSQRRRGTGGGTNADAEVDMRGEAVGCGDWRSETLDSILAPPLACRCQGQRRRSQRLEPGSSPVKGEGCVLRGLW